MSPRTSLIVLAVCAATLVPPVFLEAQESQSKPAERSRELTPADAAHRIEARRASSPPVIDGRIDEAEWADAVLVDEFVQSQPDEGAPASERTEVRLFYDGEALYVSARMYDSRPDQIVATVLRRDESHNDNDAFAITLDTYHDHRNGFFFETNPMGAQFDAQIIGEGGAGRMGGGQTFNEDWDAVWEAAGRITDFGWEVEVAIPFWGLRFDREALDAWGINFRRTIRRKSEQSYWAPVPRQFNATRLSLSGMVVGIEGIGRPRNLQVKPFALGDLSQLPSGPVSDPLSTHDAEASGDLGLDVKWTMTPNFTLDATVNTDFAQVEADDVQINLTRFPLFFPEKREFFLENAGLFDFGNTGFGGIRMLGFHSRRIGIERGRAVPILGGARLTGKTGGWNLGVLNMQTDDVPELGLRSENHGVLRVRRELGSRSSVGMLLTNRESFGDEYNRAYGFDGRWAATDELTLDGWWMRTDSSGLDAGAESAGALSADWSNGEWQVNGSFVDIGEDFDPALGFVARRGIRSYDTTIMWTPFFPDSPSVRNLSPHLSYSYLTDRDDRLLSRFVHLDWDMFLRRGDKLSVAHNRRYEALDLPFQIVPGVSIAPGEYHFDELVLELQSDQSRPAFAGLTYTWGDYWDGSYSSVAASAGFRAGARLTARMSWNRTDAELEGGDFVTDLYRLRLSYDFNTRLFLSGLFQYDNLTDQFLSNVRINFIHTPGADLFLVYNERRLTEDPDLIDRAIILKLTQLFRL